MKHHICLTLIFIFTIGHICLIPDRGISQNNDQLILDHYRQQTLDTEPEKIYQTYNQFCDAYFGVHTDDIYKETFGNQSHMIDTMEWAYISERSVVLSVNTNLPVQSYLEYSTSSGFDASTQITERAFLTHIHYLTGLEPETEYFYRWVFVDQTGRTIRSEKLRFTTRKLKNVIYISGKMEGAPYILNQPNATYLVTEDITARMML